MICRRSCAGGKSAWQRFGQRRRVWKRSNGRRTTRGAGSRGRIGNPKGGSTVQAGVWRAGREGAEQLHGPGKLDHEDEQ